MTNKKYVVSRGGDIHEDIIHGDHKDFARFLELGMLDEAWDMTLGA